MDGVAFTARLLELDVELNPPLGEPQRFFERWEPGAASANPIVRNHQTAVPRAAHIEFDHVGAHFNGCRKRGERILGRFG